MVHSAQFSVSVGKHQIECRAVGVFPGDPHSLWGILACKESRPVFRVEDRKQLSCFDGKVVEQVTFVAPVRLLLWRPIARTEVHQTVDMSDPTSVRVSFSLLKSDMMSRLHGGWHFKQLEAPSKGSVGSTEVTYTFAMWPKGVPHALRFMPGLLDAVKSAVAREAAQLFDKLAFVAHKVRPGMCILEAAREASAEVEAAGGSFKCLQLQRAGNAADAAAAAAAEAAARLQFKQQRQQQQAQKVVCHELDDVLSSDGEDDCLMELDSSGSNVTSSSSSSSSSSCTALDAAGRTGSDMSASSVRSSSGGSSVSSRDSLSSGGMTALVDSLSESFSAMVQGTEAAAAATV